MKPSAMATNDIDIGKADPLYLRQKRILERSIRGGRLEKGTVLVEGPLADIFGSSRQPVRRALSQLNEVGLVRRFDGRGYVVGGEDAPIRRVELSPGMLDVDGDERSLRKAFAWEVIYEAVERTVILQSVLGRFRVNELELARHFSVGRTVARDVMMRLQSLGMLEKDERRRWTTVPLDSERVVSLYEIRCGLEPLALRRALPHLDRNVLAQMRLRLREHIAAYPDAEPTAMDDLEFDLHIRCLMPCPNKELLSALLRTRCVLTLSKHILGIEMPLPDADPFMAEHAEVFDAMLSDDADGAAARMHAHLTSACPKVVERLERFRKAYAPPATPFIQ
jgi:DNA-binding GntR family transcriptional regulator